VNIKYPWFLEIEDYAWIGENVWIDNLAHVHIGKAACLSQGALLLCGNHDYKKRNFDLIVKGINIQERAWIGARSVVCQGVIAYPYSMLCVNSVATHDLEAYGIYRGNPAEKIKEREIID
jgi:putative colanic acid biosynthesis acetyltransferase WcaF